jgi:hypothetical protein
MDYETEGDLIYTYEGSCALGLYDNFLYLTGGDGSIIYVENILNNDIVYGGYWTKERIIISEPYVMEIYKVYEEETVPDEHLYKKKLHKYSLNLRTKEENDLKDYIIQKYD